MTPRSALAALAFVTVLCVGAVVSLATRDIDTPRTLRQTDYVGSSECRRCHTDHYTSWHRTFHRTMTQEAKGAAVLGTWDGTTLDYMGVRARMHRDRDGAPLISFVRGNERWQARVDRTVGSHRYQQYLAREADTWVRLPIAWEVGAQRFIHMNAAFLTPDPELPSGGAAVPRADYDRHVTRWNDNCIFCHNVRPNPGFDRDADRFESRVAELGIACEACHGPGADHVSRNHDPVRRYLLHLSDVADPTIRNPRRMSAERSAQVCGRCHGQRITGRIEDYYEHGDDFIPGDDLAAHSTPLSRDTTHNGAAGVFAARFWRDGTPRLTAYEYQGYLQSACREGGELSCESCHAMHAGEPKHQLRPDVLGDRMCTQCHDDLASSAAVRAHTRHDPAGSGARCVGCHMPKLVYGLVSMHVSHRIEIPDPAAANATERPDACTLCHTDQTRAWAAREVTRLFGMQQSEIATTDLSESETRLLAGDPIERAAAASALGEATLTTPRALSLLLDTMLADPYPAVRDIAARAARAHLTGTAPAFIATATPSEREEVVRQWQRLAPVVTEQRPAQELIERLRASAALTPIEIGE